MISLYRDRKVKQIVAVITIINLLLERRRCFVEMLERVLFISSLLGLASGEWNMRVKCDAVEDDFYQFNAEFLNETATINFEEYKGKE